MPCVSRIEDLSLSRVITFLKQRVNERRFVRVNFWVSFWSIIEISVRSAYFTSELEHSIRFPSHLRGSRFIFPLVFYADAIAIAKIFQTPTADLLEQFKVCAYSCSKVFRANITHQSKKLRIGRAFDAVFSVAVLIKNWPDNVNFRKRLFGFVSFCLDLTFPNSHAFPLHIDNEHVEQVNGYERVLF